VAQTFLSATSPDTLYTRDYTLAGQVQRESTIFGTAIFTLTEKFDTLGRSEGYALSNTVSGISTMISDTTHAYDPVGRLERVAVGGMGEFRYGYLPDANLVQTLAMPNGVTRTVVYEPHRDLPLSVTHTNTAGTILAQRTYFYDPVNRLADRTQLRAGDTARPDAFDYNERSELTAALLGTNTYAYAFDPIGNRQTAVENSITNAYLSNPLNQYTNILRASAPPREDLPVFDLDGNQTLLHTTTGLWHVDYNAENRPVRFTNETAVITMAYDHQGRRTEMKVMQSGATTRHERYLYRGYVQIAALDLLDATNVIHTITWDPTEPVATRPLSLQRGTNGWSYGFDQVKNVTELFDATGTLAAAYDYAPFGALTAASGPAAGLNPLTFSSEINDDPLGLIYYNFRHLNVLDGRWVNRDPIGENGGMNVFQYGTGNPLGVFDGTGLILLSASWSGTGYNSVVDFYAATGHLDASGKMDNKFDVSVTETAQEDCCCKIDVKDATLLGRMHFLQAGVVHSWSGNTYTIVPGSPKVGPVQSSPTHWHISQGLIIYHEGRHWELDYQIATRITKPLSASRKCCYAKDSTDTCETSATKIKKVIKGFFDKHTYNRNNAFDSGLSASSSRSETDVEFDKQLLKIKKINEGDWRCSDGGK
jgi:RHS repeat-associated protein